MPDDDVQAAEKLSVAQMTATHGWKVVNKTARGIIREFEVRALAAPDDAQAMVHLRKAQAVTEFWDTLTNRIDLTKYVDAGPSPTFVSEFDY